MHTGFCVRFFAPSLSSKTAMYVVPNPGTIKSTHTAKTSPSLISSSLVQNKVATDSGTDLAVLRACRYSGSSGPSGGRGNGDGNGGDDSGGDHDGGCDDDGSGGGRGGGGGGGGGGGDGGCFSGDSSSLKA